MKYADYLTVLDNHNLFCPAVKAQIVKQHLLDGVPALEFPETPKF